MKKSVTLFLIFLIFYPVQAGKVDTVQARKVALNFLQERAPLDGRKQGLPIVLQLLHPEKSAGGAALYYVFNITGRPGFIIISAEDRVFPVLAYSFESSFKDNGQFPAALAEWLKLTGEQILVVRQKQLIPEKKSGDAWGRYMNPPAKGVLDLQEVAPLLATRWNQGRYYNTLCPEDPAGQDGHVWVGCVAVAMAQVMKYWNYPGYGSGEHSYNNYTYGIQSADFAHTYYDWQAMPNSLSGYNTPVATLMYHCGVSINMGYGVSGSSASTGSTAEALKKYFDYSHNITLVRKWAYTEAQWDSLVRSQLDLGQPLIFSGGSHAFNIDGYQGSSYFHVNWGWGGAYNGYFYLDDLTPGSYDFTSGQQAVINIRPDCGEAPEDTDTLTDFSGTLWDNGHDNYNYLNCSDSRTLIAPDKATNIRISFRYFKSVEGQDTLYVHDGEDEHAAVLAVLTGDTVPDPILSTGGKVFLRFVSDAFTTDQGYEINYTCAFDDAGVTGMLLPEDHTCGRTDDSILVVVRNYGIHTLNNIPVVVEAQTPRGTEIYTAALNNPLATGESDTLFVGAFSTLEPGEYTFTCYTILPGDTLIHNNDTVTGSVSVKFPRTIPYYEEVDGSPMELYMKDWYDRNGSTYIGRDEKGENEYFSSMVSNRFSQFFVYERQIEGVTSYTGIYFDYRILGAQEWPQTADTLNGDEKIHFIVSKDCGENFDTVFTIDKSNHAPDSLFRTVYVSLAGFAGEKILIGFTTEWDSVWSTVQYDNILVVDSLNNNVIAGNDICEGETLYLTGSAVLGGTGPLTYIWQESDDGKIWRAASGINNLQNYDVARFSSDEYFRRIVTDTLFYADTSSGIFIRSVPWPIPVITPDTAICAGDTAVLRVSGGDTWQWNTGAADQIIKVSPAEDTTYSVILTNGNLCAVDTAVKVRVHPLPEVSLGPDTAACNGESITLDAGDFYAYQWNTGADTRQITVNTAGAYDVAVTNAYGCKNADTVYVTFLTCTGTGRMEEEKIIVYPNPSSGVFYIKGVLAAETTMITVMNVNGMMIKEIIPVRKILSVSLEDQPPGIYFIRIINKNGATVVKRVRKSGKPLPSR